MTLAQTLFSFKGRINRAKWWLMRLLIIVVSVIVGMIFSSLGDAAFIILIPFSICSIWANLAVNVKRWHDRDKSAWWLLIELIPLIGAIWVFIELGCLKGTYGKNRFGPDPLEHV